jgi:hypothetical protein
MTRRFQDLYVFAWMAQWLMPSRAAQRGPLQIVQGPTERFCWSGQLTPIAGFELCPSAGLVVLADRTCALLHSSPDR